MDETKAQKPAIEAIVKRVRDGKEFRVSTQIDDGRKDFWPMVATPVDGVGDNVLISPESLYAREPEYRVKG